MNESTFQTALVAALNAPGRPTRVWRQNAGVRVFLDEHGHKRAFRGAPTGSADLVGLVQPDGLYVEVEVKVDAPQTTAQKRRQRFIETWGGIYVLVRYDKNKTPEQNVLAGLLKVEAAIIARRLGQRDFERASQG